MQASAILTIVREVEAAAATTAECCERGRSAQAQFATWSQDRVDDLVAAAGWALFREDVASSLSELAVEETGIGLAIDTYERHRQRILGTLRDMANAPSQGLVETLADRGLRRYAKPVGLVAAVTPSTAPVAAIAVNALSALKTGNAMIFCPNPSVARVTRAAVNHLRAALAACGALEDLLQVLPEVTRDSVAELTAQADLVIAAGGRKTVERALTGGAPGFGAGAGNAVVVVDATADLTFAAQEIVRGKAFDHGTSCSAESCVLVQASVLDAFRDALAAAGARLLDDEETRRLAEAVWTEGGGVNRQVVGRDVDAIARLARLETGPHTRILVGRPLQSPDDPLGREKLSPVLGLGVFEQFEDGLRTAEHLVRRHGPGHSCGIYSRSAYHIEAMAERMPVSRMMVNQSTGMGNTGSFSNGMAFSVTLCCGSWGGSNSGDNVNWRHLLNYTTVSEPIPPNIPDPSLLFGRHWCAA